MWAQGGDDPAQLGNRAGVAARANHFINAGGAQAGILLEGLMDEIEIGISQRGAKARRPLRIETMRLDGAADGVRMKIELGGDGSDLPMFGEEKAPDFSDQLHRDHLWRLLS